LLPLARLSPGLPRARHPPPADPAVSAAHQRQGGALHPDPASRVGLCAVLPHLEPAQPSTARLARLLQRPAPAHGTRLPAAAGRSPEVPVTNVPGLNN